MARSSRIVALLLVAAGLTSIASAPPAEAVTLLPGSISAGVNHSCGLTGSGAAYCWGDDSSGQLGNGAGVTADQVSPSPVDISGAHPDTYSSISAGDSFTCAISAGVAYCWGSDTLGRLGNGSVTGQQDSPSVVDATGLTWSEIASGSNHACAITSVGDAYCWGSDANGELGNGSVTGAQSSPSLVDGSGWSAISAGLNFTCGITVGTAKCWGSDASEQLGDGTGQTDQTTPVAVIKNDDSPLSASSLDLGWDHACALTSLGAAYCWGSDTSGQIGDGLTSGPHARAAAVDGGSFDAISAGDVFTCALTSSGTAYCWGDDAAGQLGNGSTSGLQVSPSLVSGGLSFAVISTGDTHVCAYTVSRGSAYCWGSDSDARLGNGSGASAISPSQVVSGIDIVRSGLGTGTVSYPSIAPLTIDCGADCDQELPFLASVVLTATLGSATSVSWFNAGTCSGASCTYTVLTPALITVIFGGTVPDERISAGTAHSCALTGTGAPYCWGSDALGQVGDGATVGPQVSPVAVSGGLQLASIATGGSHSCGRTSGSVVWCWGSDITGQLGNGGTATSSDIPSQVTGFSFVQVVAGDSHTCGLTSAGVAHCWGSDGSGQLGNGSGATANQLSPSLVDTAQTFVELAAGGSHTCGITALGAAYCWGHDDLGQLGNGSTTGVQESPSPVERPTPLTAFVEITAGTSHTCARTAGGSVYCWGSDDFGQLGDDASVGGTQTSPVFVSSLLNSTRVTAGGSHTCALVAGAAYCWGADGNGQSGNGASTASAVPSAVSMPAATTFTGISAGALHTCAWTGTGGWCWGSDSGGRLGNGAVLTADQISPAQVVSRIDLVRSGLGTGTVTSSPSGIDCGTDCNEELPFLASITLNASPSATWENAPLCSTGTSCNYTVLAPATITVVFTGTLAADRLSAGGAHACALTTAGDPNCWGSDASGQVGDGATVGPQAHPVVVSGALILDSIATGGDHSCGRTAGGAVSCWGSDASGQLGNGAPGSSGAPVSVSGTFSQVVTGGSHSCALTPAGAAWCWGSDSNGQVGNGATTGNQSSPVAVVSVPSEPFVEITAGTSHTCAITRLGLAYCWGSDASGQMGNGSSTSADQASPSAVEMPAFTGFVEIAAGGSHTCARTAGGAVYCWGSDGSGQIGDATVGGTRTSPTLTSAGAVLFARLTAGGSHTCGLTSTGAAYCWGSDATGQLGNGGTSANTEVPTAVVMPTATTFIGVSAGATDTCGWTGSAAWCWGDDTDGRLGNGAATTLAQQAPSLVGADLWILKAGTGRGSISFASASYADTATSCIDACASQRVTAPFNGSVVSTATASSSEDFYGSGTSSFRGWTGGGCTGLGTCSVPYSGPVTVTAMFRSAAVQERIGAGFGHSCALDANDLAWCWGTGTSGQLGQGSTASTDIPIQAVMPAGRTFAQISVGDNHTCAIAYDGTAWCWGSGVYGRIGNGSTANVSIPTAVTLPAFTTFVEVTAGYRHTCAVAYDGKGYCWGYGAFGRLGNGLTTNFTSPSTVTAAPLGGATFSRLSAGQDHTCAVDSSGKAWCWGSDGSQQLGDGSSTGVSSVPTPVTTSGVGLPSTYARVSAGALHSCGITPAGAAWCWGTNTDGQLGDGATSLSSEPVAVNGIATALTRISAGLASTCAIGASGSWCWGSDTFGRLGNGASASSTSASPISPTSVFDQIAVGSYHSCALVLTPSVSPSCWGNDSYFQLGNGSTPTADQPAPFTVGAHLDLMKVGTGFGSVTSSPAGISCLQACDSQTYRVPFGTTTPTTLVLTAVAVGGTASLTGSPCDGASTCTVPVTSGHAITATFTATGSEFALIDAGTAHVCVVTGGSGGCWGTDASGQLGNDTSFVERASPTAVLMPAGILFSDISAGTGHTCALATSGAAYCWGSDVNGRLGNGTLSTSDLAVASLVAGGLTFRQVVTGTSHTCALTTAGAAYCWGSDGNGQLGNGVGVTGDQASPSAVAMPAGRTFTSIAAGGSHTCALADNGTAYCWGADAAGQLGNGVATTLDQVAPSLVSALLPAGVVFTSVSVGTIHSCAVASDGSAWCWGERGNGRLGTGVAGSAVVPAPAAVVMPANTTFVRISAGHAHTCALTFGGNVYCWGYNATGQVGNGTAVTALSPALVPMPAGTSRFLRVSAGEQHTCALADDTDTVADDVSRWCWGSDVNGRLGNGTTLTANSTAPSRSTAAIVLTTSGSGSANWASPLTGVCPTVCTQDVATDGSASITAVPTAGYSFNGWSGPCADPTSLTCVVSTTWSRSITASFSSVPTFALSLTKTSVSGGLGTVTSNPAGISCGTSCSSATANFASSASVVLTASAPSGSTFSGWSGACINLTGTCTVSMTAARSVTASFTSTTAGTFALSVAKTSVGAGTGTVSSSPVGISCGTTCTFNYGSGTVVTLTATPASGALFGGWTGACTNASGTCSVLMDQARSVTAKFYTTRKMTVGKTGSGTVTSSPAGINCGATCIYNFEYGTSVTLTPTPAAGWKFDKWSGSCIGTSCTLSVTADFTVTANFSQITYAMSVTRSSVSSGTGTVSSSPTGISCGTTCTALFAGGSTVTLTATAASGSRFSGWSGACTNLTGTCTVLMDQVRSVTATFTGIRTLSVSRTGSGTITSSPAGINCGTTCSFAFNYGTGVTLTATPATGYRFTGWSGSCSGTACSLTMTASYSVTANFALIVNYTLSVTRSSVSGGTGTVTSSPAGISCGPTCSASFVSGTSVTLTAAAATGSRFTGWSGACAGTSTTCVVAMTSSKSVTATFSI